MEVKKRKNRTFRIRPYSITEKGTPYKEGQPLASLHYTKSRQHSKTIHKKRLQSWYEFLPLNLNKVRGCSATDFYCLQNYKKIIIKTLQDNFEPDFVERFKLTTPPAPVLPSLRPSKCKQNQPGPRTRIFECETEVHAFFKGSRKVSVFRHAWKRGTPFSYLMLCFIVWFYWWQNKWVKKQTNLHWSNQKQIG